MSRTLNIDNPELGRSNRVIVIDDPELAISIRRLGLYLGKVDFNMVESAIAEFEAERRRQDRLRRDVAKELADIARDASQFVDPKASDPLDELYGPPEPDPWRLQGASRRPIDPPE